MRRGDWGGTGPGEMCRGCPAWELFTDREASDSVPRAALGG